jgi:uncharacterized protein YbaA (DUF1428 family)
VRPLHRERDVAAEAATEHRRILDIADVVSQTVVIARPGSPLSADMPFDGKRMISGGLCHSGTPRSGGPGIHNPSP